MRCKIGYEIRYELSYYKKHLSCSPWYFQLRFWINRTHFECTTQYKSYASAEAAAKRLMKQLKGADNVKS